MGRFKTQSSARLAITGVLGIIVLGIAVSLAVPRLRALAPEASKEAAARTGTGLPAEDPSAPRVFRYYLEAPGTLDPGLAADAYSSMVVSQIYSPLVGLTSDLEPTPQLAESWTISRDGLVYAFTIRAGVRFHNGREVTADDLVYSLTRLFREPYRSQGLAAGYLDAIVGAPEFMQGKARSVAGIRILDPHRIEIRLSRPYSALLSALALDQTAVVPREVLEQGHEVEAHPIGCGPFRFVRREGDARIVLAANPAYFMGKPDLDSLIFYTPNGDVETQGGDALLSGRATMASLPVDRIEEFRAHSGLSVVRWQDLSLQFIGMNTKVPPLNDPRVRRAIALAMDREAMLNLRPTGKILAHGILPPGLHGYSPETLTYPHDVMAAKAALAEAGYGPDRPLPRLHLYKAAGTPASRQIDTLMVASLAEAGIRIDLKHVSWTQLDSIITGRHAQMFGLAWVADVPEPDTFLRALFQSRSGTNYFRFSDRQVDSLLEVARQTTDSEVRTQAYQAVERRVVQEAPFVPLFHSSTFVGLRNEVSGLEINPLGISTLAMEKLHLGAPRDDADRRQSSR
jgi:peptide/nickel transport system substrate-binding protein